jgi:hypothetical protein
MASLLVLFGATHCSSDDGENLNEAGPLPVADCETKPWTPFFLGETDARVEVVDGALRLSSDSMDRACSPYNPECVRAGVTQRAIRGDFELSVRIRGSVINSADGPDLMLFVRSIKDPTQWGSATFWANPQGTDVKGHLFRLGTAQNSFNCGTLTTLGPGTLPDMTELHLRREGDFLGGTVGYRRDYQWDYRDFPCLPVGVEDPALIPFTTDDVEIGIGLVSLFAPASVSAQYEIEELRLTAIDSDVQPDLFDCNGIQ